MLVCHGLQQFNRVAIACHKKAPQAAEAECRLGDGKDKAVTVCRVRWRTEFEDCDVLALFGSDFADDFAKALDKMGWMIIRQPRHPDDQRWNMNRRAPTARPAQTMVCFFPRNRSRKSCSFLTAGLHSHGAVAVRGPARREPSQAAGPDTSLRQGRGAAFG